MPSTSRVLLLATLLALAPIVSASAWTEIRREDGVSVEEEPVPGRALPKLRGIVVIKAPVEEVLEWIRDVDTYPSWMHDCEEARLLKAEAGVTYSYNRIGAPWPVSDRDVVLRSELVSPPKDGAARVEFRSTDEVAYDAGSGTVRMPRLVGHYDLTPAAGGGTRVEYVVDSDPGGSLPAWLVRSTSRNLPFRTLQNLRAKLETARSP